MAQQVKFYSVASLPSDANAGGVYFVNGGELYKGSSRFGLGKVTVASVTTGITGARGDIVVTGEGAGWVYDGSAWQPIGGDISSLKSSWRADISSWTAGLAKGGTGSYITGITQGADGKVTASAAAFPTLGTGTTDGTVKLGILGADAKVSGWDTVKTDITNLKAVVSYSGTGDSVVTATTGSFTNLTVTDTATFNVTSVVASSLTVNGSTIEQIADSRIAAISSVTQTSTSTGITVSVTTSGGSVTAVSVDASAFGNVMKFRGVVASTADVTSPASGDIVVIGSEPTGGAVSGQEYIYSGSDWELIGDQNTYALNAYSSTATVYAGAATLPAAVSAAGAAIDTLNTKVSALESAVTGGISSAGWQGVTVSVSIAATTAAPIVDVAVSATDLNKTLGTSAVANKTVATSIGATGVDTALATEKAVRDAITAAALVWLSADGTPAT